MSDYEIPRVVEISHLMEQTEVDDFLHTSEITPLRPVQEAYWNEHRDYCQKGLELAEKRLGELAVLYSGQLRLF